MSHITSSEHYLITAQWYSLQRKHSYMNLICIFLHFFIVSTSNRIFELVIFDKKQQALLIAGS